MCRVFINVSLQDSLFTQLLGFVVEGWLSPLPHRKLLCLLVECVYPLGATIASVCVLPVKELSI